MRKNNDLLSNNNYELNSARSFKLNYSDLNKYMNQVRNINSIRISMNKPNKISLNKYFNIGQINLDNNIINNNNSLKTLYYKSNTNQNNKQIKNKYNSYINKKNKNALTYDSNYIYQEAGNIIQNNISSNINKIKKEKELLNLKKVLNELKSKNNSIKNELSLLKNQNYKLQTNNNNTNKNIYTNIKNILNNKSINNNKINEKILNIFKTKKYKSLSNKEKINLIRNIYLNEKLKNSLIDKTCLLYMNFNNKNKNEINGSGINNGADENIYRWITSTVENIEKLKKNNNKIKMNIKNLIEEKEMYEKYFNTWLNMFGINKKEELIKKIDGLINYKNINSNEEAKLFKMLLNKKE